MFWNSKQGSLALHFLYWPRKILKSNQIQEYFLVNQKKEVVVFHFEKCLQYVEKNYTLVVKFETFKRFGRIYS